MFFLLLALCLCPPLPAAGATGKLRVKLNLKERSDVRQRQQPITSGVPLPQGAIFPDKKSHRLPLKLVDERGKTVPAHFKLTAPWPDGSARWVLLDFQADFEPETDRSFYLEQTDVPLPAPITPLKAREDEEQITVDTGAIRFQVNKLKFNLLDQVLIKSETGERQIIAPGHEEGIVLLGADNQKYLAALQPPREIRIEDINPFRLVILARGQYREPGGGNLFHPGAAAYTVRIYAYAGKDYLRVFFTLENNGRYGFRHEGNKSDTFPFSALSLVLPLQLEPSCKLAAYDYGKSFSFGQDSFFLFQRHALIDYYDESKNFQYLVRYNDRQVDSGKRAEGWLELRGEKRACSVVIRYFWQNYPKALEVRGNKLFLHLWPKGEKWPPDAENFYRMRGGTHKGYEILLRFYDPRANKLDNEQLLAAFNKPVLALASPHWFSRTKALGWIAPAGLSTDEQELNEALQRYEKLQRCKVHEEYSETQHEEIPPSTVYTEREKRGEGMDWYGWMDFGDLAWGGENGEGAYASGHYDWPYGMLLNFVRSGDYAFFDLGDEMVRHRMDVDQYHSKTGSPWLANFAWNEFGDHGRGRKVWEPRPSHTWLRGLALYHYLTGDPKAREVALAVGEATRYYWTHDWGSDGRPGDSELRVQGWSIENLIELYRMTGKKSYLDLATTVYRERTAPFITPDGYTGNARDVNIYQLVLVLEPLIELDLLIKDEALRDDFLRILEFLLRRAYSGGKVQQLQETTLYQQYYLPYMMNVNTGYKNSAAPGYNFMTCNALAYAYWITGREEYRKLSRRIFKDAVFYWQEDTVSFEIERRSAIAYAAAHFPGSCTKVHGWINRYPQIFLYLLNRRKQDTIPPAAINDLESLEYYGKVILDWTAPGDDENKGKAARYQIKYSKYNIASELRWLQAHHVKGEPVPADYASLQRFLVSGLKPGKKYYFAIRSLDEQDNISPLSNVTSIILK